MTTNTLLAGVLIISVILCFTHMIYWFRRNEKDTKRLVEKTNNKHAHMQDRIGKLNEEIEYLKHRLNEHIKSMSIEIEILTNTVDQLRNQ